MALYICCIARLKHESSLSFCIIFSWFGHVHIHPSPSHTHISLPPHRFNTQHIHKISIVKIKAGVISEHWELCTDISHLRQVNVNSIKLVSVCWIWPEVKEQEMRQWVLDWTHWREVTSIYSVLCSLWC